jgi:hypothetical protein
MESFLVETGFYLFLAGFLQAVLALIIAPVFLLVTRQLFGISYWSLLRAYLIFNAFLLIWGCLGSYVFLRITYGKLYVSADRMLDWLPFVPFGQWVLDQTLGPVRGHLIGDATLHQLRLLWCAVAVPVWLLALVSTALVVRRSFWPFPPFRGGDARGGRAQ